MNTRPLIALALLAFVVVVTAATAGAQEHRPERPVIVTTGEAVMKTAPDRAFVTVTAEARAQNPRQAQKQNAEAMERVQKDLKREGIGSDAIRTVHYDIQPEFDYRDGRQKLRGYVARNSIEVRIDNIEKVGEVVDTVVQSGATSIGGVRFDLKDRDALERKALQAAVADARARADAAAAGAGVTIERVARIEEQRTSFRPPVPMMVEMRGVAASADTAQTPIAPGEMEVRANVVLTVEIRGR